ncbi:hypothetical protein [Streptomyces sp. NPDC087538]|uniref:hypothetical protein n=1 Tax=Streptomyces sp. NPDC087538 TaxID=3365797 RepID=UPI00380E0257
MPLSVPLLLVPGEPGRHYTVHLHRTRWDHADTPGLALVDAIRTGDNEAAQDAVTGALRWLTAEGQ